MHPDLDLSKYHCLPGVGDTTAMVSVAILLKLKFSGERITALLPEILPLFYLHKKKKGNV